ncbi:MAG: Uma2 family endonuclease [Pseudomonadota bacterium]
MADGTPHLNTNFPDGPGYREKRFTVDELFALGELGALDDANRYELWDGRLVMTPPPGNHHGRAESRILRRLLAALLELDPDEQRYVVQPNPGLEMSNDTFLQPDLAIVSPTDPDETPRLTPSHVHLCIEVSRSTVRGDLELKRLRYAQAGIAEYWVLNTWTSALHLFRQPENGDYAETRVLGTTETLSPLFEPRIVLAVDQLF